MFPAFKLFFAVSFGVDKCFDVRDDNNLCNVIKWQWFVTNLFLFVTCGRYFVNLIGNLMKLRYTMFSELIILAINLIAIVKLENKYWFERTETGPWFIRHALLFLAIFSLEK